ncbi:MAG: YIP1 family protein [Deltaproteobacteria bacterium]|jgi:hypothetical protein|nr:YIP1 family protein [Deltaproteobacteria bacterium]
MFPADPASPANPVGRTEQSAGAERADRTSPESLVKPSEQGSQIIQPDPADTAHTDVWSAVEDLNARWERDQEEDASAAASDKVASVNSNGTRQTEADQDLDLTQADKGSDYVFPDEKDRAAENNAAEDSDDEDLRVPGPKASARKDRLNADRSDSFASGGAGKAGGAGARDIHSGHNREAGRPGLLANSGSVPWEYKGGFLHPLGLLRTILLSFTRVPEFFGGIPALGSLVPALIFVMLMRGLQFFITFAVIEWDIVNQQGEQLSLTMAELTKISAPQLLITTLFIVIFLHFACTLIVNFMVRLVEPDRPRFNVTFKVLAYALSPLIFIILPQVGILLAEIGSLLLLTLGLRHAYQLSWGKTLTVMLPLILLMILLNMNSLRLLS